jgi:hypothetical protein
MVISVVKAYTLVVRGSLKRVHMKVLWLMVRPSTQLRPSVTCAQHRTEHAPVRDSHAVPWLTAIAHVLCMLHAGST